MVRFNGHSAQVFDSTNGFHKDRDRPPWEIKVNDKLFHPSFSAHGKLSDEDLLLKEKQSQIQAGDMKAPESITSRFAAPIDLYTGGTYQSGNQFLDKMDALRTRIGLDAITPGFQKECEGGNLIKTARNPL